MTNKPNQMKKILYLLFPLITAFLLISCSSSQETTTTETKAEDSVYVFDEQPVDTATVPMNPEPAVTPPMPGKYFIVQIGAFTTKDKAEDFANKSRVKLDKDIVVIYSNQVNLFVVQLTTPFNSRMEAEAVRNDLWKMPDYKDAWILTVTK